MKCSRTSLPYLLFMTVAVSPTMFMHIFYNCFMVIAVWYNEDHFAADAAIVIDRVILLALYISSIVSFLILVCDLIVCLPLNSARDWKRRGIARSNSDAIRQAFRALREKLAKEDQMAYPPLRLSNPSFFHDNYHVPSLPCA
jgi:hypothetical protein